MLDTKDKEVVVKSEVKDEILENKFGVLLDRKTTFAIERELEHLMDRCPSVATPLLQLKIKGQYYQSKLLINCFDIVFQVEGRGKDPLTVFKLLERKMDKKLLAWRKASYPFFVQEV